MADSSKKRRTGTAVIAGASSGIGEAFARRMADDGMDLILVARREDRLDTLRTELERRYSVRVDPHVADLASPEDLMRLEQKLLETPQLELLVNNAAHCKMGPFTELGTDVIDYGVRLNIVAPTRLTRAALPKMLERNSGAIINVSSVAAFMSTVNGAMYCASKAYLNHFTESLAGEIHGSRVRVQVLCPGLTRTEFPRNSGMNTADLPDTAWMSPEEVVDESLRALARDSVVCVPRFGNRLLPKLMNALPRGMAQWMGRRAVAQEDPSKSG